MMLAKFFNKSKPVNYIILFLLFLGYFLNASLNINIERISLGDFIFNRLYLLVGFLLLFFLFNFILSKNKLTFDTSYGFLFFVLLLGIFPKTLALSKVFYSTIFLYLFFRKTYSLRSNKDLFRKLFDAGFWLGIAFTLSPYSILFFFLLYIALYGYQKITIQTLIIPILGFTTPLVLYFTYLFWNDNTSVFLHLFSFKPLFDTHIKQITNNSFSVIFIGVLTLISIILKTPIALSVSNTFKKSWILILLNLILSVLFFLFLEEKKGEELILLFFPLAIILANGIEIITNKWVKEGIIWLLLISSLISSYYSFTP